MARNLASSYRPSVSDEAVKAKTGKVWAEWFRVLDEAGAAKLPHKAIAELVHEKHKVPGWWAQMVTVEYERARGLRAVHQKADGYSANASKTVNCPLPRLFAAASNPDARKKWFPKGSFEQTSITRNKYLRGKWNGDARVDFGFYPKDKDKAQIAVQVNKLASADDVARERAAWKQALETLAAIAAR